MKNDCITALRLIYDNNQDVGTNNNDKSSNEYKLLGYPIVYNEWRYYYKLYYQGEENRINQLNRLITFKESLELNLSDIKLHSSFNNSVSEEVKISNKLRRVNRYIEDIESFNDKEQSFFEQVSTSYNALLKYYKELDSYLSRNPNYMNSREILISKKSYKIKNYPLNDEYLKICSVENHTKLLLVFIISRTINEYIKRQRYCVDIQFSDKAANLAKRLILELRSSGIDGRALDILNAISKQRPLSWPHDSLSRQFKYSAPLKSLNRVLFETIASLMVIYFDFSGTTKGRPYPSVIIEILALFDIHWSLRHIERMLEDFDQFDSNPTSTD